MADKTIRNVVEPVPESLIAGKTGRDLAEAERDFRQQEVQIAQGVATLRAHWIVFILVEHFNPLRVKACQGLRLGAREVPVSHAAGPDLLEPPPAIPIGKPQEGLRPSSPLTAVQQ